MRRIIFVVIALCAISCSHALFGQDIEVDLTNIDTGLVIVKMAAMIDSSTTDTVIEVPIDGAGVIEIQMTYDSTAHSMVKFDVSASGAISNVAWKPDNNDTTVYHALDTARFALKANNTKISFKGCMVVIDDSEVDLADLQLYYEDPNADASTFFGNEDGTGKYAIFPGNYFLTSSASHSSVGFLLQDDCHIDYKVRWRIEDGTQAAWERLHADFYEIVGTNVLILKGQAVDVKQHLLTDQTSVIQGIVASKADLQDNVVATLKLLPGQYRVAVNLKGEPGVDMQFDLLNKTGRLSPVIQWNDLMGGRTNGVMAALEPGWVYVTPESWEAAGGLPPIDVDAAPQVYAVLKDKLDAGYYISKAGEFWLRYDERYEESTDLNLRILDKNNVEVPLNAPVTRHYGANWIQLQLPSGFDPGEYYVLEVRSEKGDLSMLRFRYE
jgi:hypothetical protein